MRVLLLLLGVLLSGCFGGADDHETVILRVEGGDLDTIYAVRFAPGAEPTTNQYTLYGKDHANGTTAHDILWLWSVETGTPIEVEWFDASFGHGYSLCAIDGFPVAQDDDGQHLGCFDRGGFWSIEVDGEAAEVGMSDLIIHDEEQLSFTWTPF